MKQWSARCCCCNKSPFVKFIGAYLSFTHFLVFNLILILKRIDSTVHPPRRKSQTPEAPYCMTTTEKNNGLLATVSTIICLKAYMVSHKQVNSLCYGYFLSFGCRNKAVFKIIKYYFLLLILNFMKSSICPLLLWWLKMGWLY